MFTFTILDIKGKPVAAGDILSDMTGIMAKRWGGKLIETATGKVLFDLAIDRVTAKEWPNAAEQRAEYVLANSRTTNS